MREIKFKGKAKMSIEELDDMHFEHDNGWLVGNLITNGKNGRSPYIVGNLVETDPEYIVHEFWMPVYPESVGQYTGLTDKHGTEIYEGDIVKSATQNDIIKFEYGSFMVMGLHEDKYEREYSMLYHFLVDATIPNEKHSKFDGVTTTLEVTGNIYENPELSEGEE
ncbi:MAG TPA: YopX family protein [Massilibacterium sp.]|nr:YopX family protein [Massilibacterium sp.]